MTEWEPATEAEADMRDALRANDQELYFQILARTDLLLPVSAQALTGHAPMGWGTWTTGGRTHVLAFTSAAALKACLAENAGSSRRTAYHDLASNWPNHEWWLAVNPGLPIEGYLPAWFVAQLARGDVRLPGRTPVNRSREERLEMATPSRGSATVPSQAAPTDKPAGPVGATSSEGAGSGSATAPVGVSGALVNPTAEHVTAGWRAPPTESARSDDRSPGPAVSNGHRDAVDSVHDHGGMGRVGPGPSGYDQVISDQVESDSGGADSSFDDGPPLRRESVEPTGHTPAARSGAEPPQHSSLSAWYAAAIGTPPAPPAPAVDTSPAPRPVSPAPAASMEAAPVMSAPVSPAPTPAGPGTVPMGFQAEPAGPRAAPAGSDFAPAGSDFAPGELDRPARRAEFKPANEVEQSLLEAAGDGSTETFLSTLLLAKVLLPVDLRSIPGSRPGEDGFVWCTERIDGADHIVVYTSPERLADHLPGAVETISVKFVQLIRRWPKNDWSFAINPGTPVGAKLPGSQIVALASWADEVGLGSEPELAEPVQAPSTGEPTTRSNYAPASEDPGQPTMMQKAIAPSQVGFYLDRGYDRVSGFVHRASEIAHLSTPAQLEAALGLDYPGSPFSRDAAEVFVVRWPAYRPSLYRIPYGGQNEPAMRAMEGWVIERAPFRGNGFAPGEGSEVVAEFKVDSVRLPHGARLCRIGADGTDTVIAILDSDATTWRRVGGTDA